MADNKQNQGRRRPGKNTFTTKSGNTIKLNRSLGDRIKAGRDAKARRRAAYLATLPKNPVKRFFARLSPKHMAQYWFSRDGAIMALKILGISIVAGFVLLVGVFAYFRKDLPNLKDISNSRLGGSITYYDRSGQTVLWQDYDAVKRVQVQGDQMSKYVKQATIAIEDKDFYKHGAFDPAAIIRAGINDVFGSGGTQGGSTITQQLVKLNLAWTQDRTMTRKVKELILAVELEREYTKDEILTGYLNTAPYGNIQYGVETAARDYFNVSAKELTLPQSAMLAAIPKAPSTYSPYGPYYDPQQLIGRQRYIIDKMVEQKMITKQEGEDAKKVDVLAQVHPFLPKYSGMKAPYFVLAAKEELEARYGAATVQRGGWKVITTLDMNLQNIADDQVQKGLTQVRRQGGDTAAFVAEDVKTGQIVALVGGANFFSNNPNDGHQINFARSRIPPGSTFKPYDYATMIENTTNTGAGSVIYDSQTPLPGYPCTDKSQPTKTGDNSKKCLWDYDFRYPGPVTLRYALGGSRNVPAVKAMLTVGTNKVISTAQEMGLKSGYKCYYDEELKKEAPCYGASAIGDGAFLYLDEHVNGYATLSRLGAYIPKTYILKIIDGRGKTLEEWKAPKAKQVLRPDTAYIIDDILADPNASYLPASYKAHRYKGWHFGFKTGTTNDGKDGLMMSISTQYAAGVWVGYHSRQKVMSGSMEYMTEPILKGWMNAAHDSLMSAGVKPASWVQPSTVKTLPAFIIRSKLSNLGEVIPSPANDIYPSWYQANKQVGNTNQVIDKISGKKATACTPDLAKETLTASNVNAFSADKFTNSGAGGAATGDDDVHKCDDAKPMITLTAPPTCSALSGCAFTVTVTQGTHALSSDRFAGAVELMINGQKVQTQFVSASPSTITFNYTPTTSGPATVSAQITDSVLYTATAESSVTFDATTTNNGNNDNTNNNQGNDNGGGAPPLPHGRRNFF